MRRRITIPIVLTTLAMLAALTGCSGGSPTATQTTAPGVTIPSVAKDPALAGQLPASIQSAGVIRMATDATYPPFESMDGGKVVGFDADLAQAIGEVLGVRVEYVNTAFDAIIPALAANKVDMAMSSIGDNKEREKTVDFATYYWNGTLVLVRKGNPKQIQADKACGAHIGVIRGSLQHTEFLPAQGPKCEAEGKPAPIAEVYQNSQQAQLAVQSGRIDGVMVDAPPLLVVTAQQPDIFETVGPLIRNPNPGGVAFPKGSQLAAPVRDAINVLIENGTYAAILKKWNLDTIKIDKSAVNGAIS